MAITVTEPTAEVASSSNTDSYSLASFTPTANEFLVLWVVATATYSAGSVSNTGTSLTWIKQNSVLYNSTDTLYCFTADVPSSTSASVITFSCTGDNATGCILMIQSCSNVNKVFPVRQTVSGTGNAATATLNNAAGVSNNAFLTAMGLNSSSVTVNTNPTGFTKSSDVTYTVPGTRGAAWYDANGFTGTSTAPVLSSTSNWGRMSIEIRCNDNGPAYSHFYMAG